MEHKGIKVYGFTSEMVPYASNFTTENKPAEGEWLVEEFMAEETTAEITPEKMLQKVEIGCVFYCNGCVRGNMIRTA